SMRLQELSWLLGAVGRYREMQQVFNEAMGGPHPSTALSQEDLDAVGEAPLEAAEQVVLQAAQAQRIVILNEMHHQVEHCAFGARLMPQLKAMGVETVAWESSQQAGSGRSLLCFTGVPAVGPNRRHQGETNDGGAA